MDIALWGYKLLGKRTAESMLKYWGGKYRVTKIYDPSRTGEMDPCWNLTVEAPSSVKEDYEKGLFEKIMLCIMDGSSRTKIQKEYEEAGVPVLYLGDEGDFLFPEDFGAETVTQEYGCRIYRYKEALVSPVDFYDRECMYVFDSAGKILNSQWVTNNNYDPNRPLMYPFRLKDPLPHKVFMPGSYCVLTKEFCTNYWHFTFQCLIEAYLLESVGFTGTYIISDRTYNRDALIMMGIAPDRIMTTESFSIHTIYVLEEIYGAEIDLKDKKLNAGILAGMSAMMKKKLKQDPMRPKYIYVKRVGARKLKNGDEIAAGNGFSTIIPEEYSVNEQMTFFYNADIVLCPHGANSTNCLYMRPGSVFIEVFSDRWYNDVNSEACRENHIHHIKVVGTADQVDESGMLDDYTVPEDRILPAIKTAFSLLEKGKE